MPGKHLGVQVEFTGIKELMANFAALRGRARGQILKGVVQKAAKSTVLPDAISNLEDVGAVRTGALRAAIRRRGAKVDKVRNTYARVSVGWPKKAAHGIFVEYGFTDQAGVFHPPRPFLRPAVYKNKLKIRKDIANDFWKALKQVKLLRASGKI